MSPIGEERRGEDGVYTRETEAVRVTGTERGVQELVGTVHSSSTHTTIALVISSNGATHKPQTILLALDFVLPRRISLRRYYNVNRRYIHMYFVLCFQSEFVDSCLISHLFVFLVNKCLMPPVSYVFRRRPHAASAVSERSWRVRKRIWR